MKQNIGVICERCNSQFRVTKGQIGNNIGRDRILCENCYEWENIPTNF
jgi:predicted Zn finger-like uncharacterized protein